MDTRAILENGLYEFVLNCPKSEWDIALFFHLACTNGDVKTAHLMIQNGCDIDKQGFDQRTPLHMACTYGHYEIVKMLCAKGANPHIRSGTDQTPFTSALIYRKFECVIELIRYNVRLPYWHGNIPIFAFNLERGVLLCRRIVIAFLRVKRAGNLSNWDKFLLKEIALEVWKTRLDGWFRF